MKSTELIRTLQLNNASEDPRAQAVAPLFTAIIDLLNDNTQIDDLVITQNLKDFLWIYWRFTAFKGADYFQAAFDPVNQNNLAIARLIAQENEAVHRILIPESQQVAQADDVFYPYQYLLSEHGMRLIPILDLFEYANIDPGHLFAQKKIGDRFFYGLYKLTMNDLLQLRTQVRNISIVYYDALEQAYYAEGDFWQN